jgi:hypothetical protein
MFTNPISIKEHMVLLSYSFLNLNRNGSSGTHLSYLDFGKKDEERKKEGMLVLKQLDIGLLFRIELLKSFPLLLPGILLKIIFYPPSQSGTSFRSSIPLQWIQHFSSWCGNRLLSIRPRQRSRAGEPLARYRQAHGRRC